MSGFQEFLLKPIRIQATELMGERFFRDYVQTWIGNRLPQKPEGLINAQPVRENASLANAKQLSDTVGFRQIIQFPARNAIHGGNKATRSKLT